MKGMRARLATLFICGLLVGATTVVPNPTYADDAVQEEPASSTAIDAVAIESPEREDGDAGGWERTSGNEENHQEPPVPEAATSNAEPDEAEPEEPELYDVSYIDENCNEQLAEGCTPLDGSATRLVSGWYVLRSNVTLDHELTIEGNVCIVLANDQTLTAQKGIRVRRNATLTLYGEKDHPGKLVAHQGIVRQLTADEKAEEEAWVAAEREADPDFSYEEPRILFVWPCLSVVAGDHAPWPSDAAEPDPDPEHAPKQVKQPVLKKQLLSKAYVCIMPRAEHAMLENDDGLVYENDHYTCSACGAWFEDPEGTLRLSEEECVARLVAQSEAEATTNAGEKVTITFDANGGSGSMEPMVVTSGEPFVLPACGFTPPEGMEFSMWSLGTAGSSASVPTDTTVRAWWKKASSSNGGNGGTNGSGSNGNGETGTGGEGSSADSQEAGASDTGQTSENNTTGSSSGNAPGTGDRLSAASAIAVISLFLGSAFVWEGRSRQAHGRRLGA